MIEKSEVFAFWDDLAYCEQSVWIYAKAAQEEFQIGETPSKLWFVEWLDEGLKAKKLGWRKRIPGSAGPSDDRRGAQPNSAYTG